METVKPKIKYREVFDGDKWHAEQTADGKQRISAHTYTTREDLVVDIAFGHHQWADWEPINAGGAAHT